MNQENKDFINHLLTCFEEDPAMTQVSKEELGILLLSLITMIADLNDDIENLTEAYQELKGVNCLNREL